MKKVSSAPIITAPITLAAEKFTARRITDVKTVPSIPTRSAVILEPAQRLVTVVPEFAVMSVRIRTTIAMPKVTHKKADVSVMMPIIRNIAATIPMIKLPKTAKNVQLYPQPQVVFAIIFTSDTVYEKNERW